MMSPQQAAKLLGGEASRNGRVHFPGIGHSPRDRSASMWFDPLAPEGFTVHSFAGDDPLALRDHVRSTLGLPPWRPDPNAAPQSRPQAQKQDSQPDDEWRRKRALGIWAQAVPIEGTPVELYLGSRGLPLPADAGALRYHRACPFGKTQTPAMLALVRGIHSNLPQAIHRTALNLKGEKIRIDGVDRMFLGLVGNGAVKLTPDEHVTTCLGVGEGIESTLSMQLNPKFGFSPVWSLLSAGGLASFPVLAGIECLWIAEDFDEAGIDAADKCAQRWIAAGREVWCSRASNSGMDLNDIVKMRETSND